MFFDDERNDPDKNYWNAQAEKLVKAWLRGNKLEMFEVIGGRWFQDTVSTDRYVRYFLQTYGHLQNDSVFIVDFRVLGTGLRDEWSNHGFSNERFHPGDICRKSLQMKAKTEYLGFAWDLDRKCAASFRLAQQNTKFLRQKMLFEPRSPSKYIAYRCYQ